MDFIKKIRLVNNNIKRKRAIDALDVWYKKRGITSKPKEVIEQMVDTVLKAVK